MGFLKLLGATIKVAGAVVSFRADHAAKGVKDAIDAGKEIVDGAKAIYELVNAAQTVDSEVDAAKKYVRDHASKEYKRSETNTIGIEKKSSNIRQIPEIKDGQKKDTFRFLGQNSDDSYGFVGNGTYVTLDEDKIYESADNIRIGSEAEVIMDGDNALYAIVKEEEDNDKYRDKYKCIGKEGNTFTFENIETGKRYEVKKPYILHGEYIVPQMIVSGMDDSNSLWVRVNSIVTLTVTSIDATDIKDEEVLATLESGASIRVPQRISVGDKIRIDTIGEVFISRKKA